LTSVTQSQSGEIRPGFCCELDSCSLPVGQENKGAFMEWSGRFTKAALVALLPGLITLSGCENLAPIDKQSLLFPSLHRSEVFGFLAGFGTTFASMPDLIAMLRRQSSAGMNPRMAAIMGAFQVLWVYYGLLIASRPVILWNVVAVSVNSLSVGAYLYFVRKQKK
jgi:MtN3 and saliva related transmembrane protein